MAHLFTANQKDIRALVVCLRHTFVSAKLPTCCLIPYSMDICFFKTRHSGDRYNRSDHSSGAIPCDNHKYFETESEHELWEKWRLQFVEDSPHGYSKCSVCKIFQLNDCMNLGTLWNNILRYLGIIHYL